MGKTTEEVFFGGNGFYENLEKSKKYLSLEEEYRMIRDDLEEEDAEFAATLEELLDIHSAMAMEQAYAAFRAGIRFCFDLALENIPDLKKTPD